MSLKCIVKEANLKKLPNVQFYLYNIPEKKKSIEIVSRAVVTMGFGAWLNRWSTGDFFFRSVKLFYYDIVMVDMWNYALVKTHGTCAKSTKEWTFMRTDIFKNYLEGRNIPGLNEKCEEKSNCITNVWNNIIEGGGGKKCWLLKWLWKEMESIRLKMKGTIHKYCTLIKLSPMGGGINSLKLYMHMD